jgi:hypothetical protein
MHEFEFFSNLLQIAIADNKSIYIYMVVYAILLYIEFKRREVSQGKAFQFVLFIDNNLVSNFLHSVKHTQKYYLTCKRSYVWGIL